MCHLWPLLKWATMLWRGSVTTWNGLKPNCYYQVKFVHFYYLYSMLKTKGNALNLIFSLKFKILVIFGNFSCNSLVPEWQTGQVISDLFLICEKDEIEMLRFLRASLFFSLQTKKRSFHCLWYFIVLSKKSDNNSFFRLI